MTFGSTSTLYADPLGLWRNFDSVTVGGVVFPTNPGVVVDAARLDAIDYTITPWLAGYNKIIGSGNSQSITGIRASQRYSSLTYTGLDQGIRILGGTEVPSGIAADAYHIAARDDGIACAVQAYLWAITGTSTYRTNAIAILDCYKDVTSLGPGGVASGNTSYKPLFAAWGMMGMVQALSVLGAYETRSTAVSNFATHWWPSLWHGLGGNWLASFAAARLGIAVAAGDVDLWERSVAYYDTVIKANIWLTTDGSLVNELPRNEVTNAAPALSLYSQHWWNDVPASSRSSANLENGQYCEYTRDDGHMAMGISGLMSGCWTIQNQTGDAFDTYGDRLITCLEFTAAYLLGKLDASQTPTGGLSYTLGWLLALSAFGSIELPNVAELISRSTDISVPFTANESIAHGLLFPVGT